jgi:hypothetical protein
MRLGSILRWTISQVATSGTRKFDFRALVPGRTIIHFSLSRPWEKTAQSLKQAQVTAPSPQVH